MDPLVCMRVDITYSTLAYTYNALWQAEQNAGLAAISNVPAEEQAKAAYAWLDQAVQMTKQVEELVPGETDSYRKRYLETRLRYLRESTADLGVYIKGGIPKYFRTKDIKSPELSVHDLPYRFSYAVITLQYWEGRTWNARSEFLKQSCPKYKGSQ